MSALYNEYLIEHKSNVVKGFDWLSKNLPGIFLNDQIKSKCEWLCMNAHDQSKYDKEEYDAYDKYFYGSRSYEVVEDFKLAWSHHIHHNPHHWQHWVLLNDDEGEECLEIPLYYIIEMICDWWSFSWKTGDLMEIFNYYDRHKDKIKMNGFSRNHLEDILKQMREKLEASNSNE